MFIRIYPISLFMFLISVFSGQLLADGISGKVIDYSTKRPVFGALIELMNENNVISTVTSDVSGEFTFIQEPDPKHIINVNTIGYHKNSILVSSFLNSGAVIELQHSPIQFEPVQIIAQSESMNRQRSGTAFKINAKAVNIIKPIGTQELLTLVPGVNAYADDGFGNSRLSIGIRGINPRRSSRVLIMEDGIPIQPAVYVYPNTYYNPPAERIDEVEVIKGSAAVRYGPQTMGGVINYKTIRPGKKHGLSTQFTAGNNGYYSLNSQFLGIKNGKFTTDLQALYKRGDGFRQNNGFQQYNSTVKTQYVFDERRVLYIKVNGNFEDSNATYTGLTEYSFFKHPKFNPKNFDNFNVKRGSIDLIYTARISDSVIENTSLYFNVFDRRWWREDDVFTRATSWNNGEVTPVPYYQTGDIVRVGGGQSSFGILRTFFVGGIARDYQFPHTIWGILGKAEVGARAHWERFVDDKKVGATPDARSGIFYTGIIDDPDNPVAIVGQSHHYETTAFSFYAKDKMAFGNISLDSGIRVEAFRQERVDRLRGSILADKVSVVLLPGFGINYSLGNYNLFGGIHRGYTPPSSGTLKITNFGADVTSGGLDLKSEKSWNIEVGIRRHGRTVSAEATSFFVTISDLVAAGRGTAFKNLGNVNTWGIEFGGQYATSSINYLLPDLNISYTYLQTEIIDGLITSTQRAGGVTADISGNKLPYAPEHTITFGISKVTNNGLSFRSDISYIGRVFTDFENIETTGNRGDTGPVPSYSIINASVEYPILNSWNAFVSAKNITDNIYIGSRLHSNPGQPQAHLSSGILVGPRRQINIGLRRSL